MSCSVARPPRGSSDARAVTSPLDIDIALGRAHEVALTVRGPIGSEAAATVAELVRALVTTGAVHVIVDLEGAAGAGEVTRMLGPVGATLRSRGGRLLIAGDGEALCLFGSDLQDAFSAYRAVGTIGSVPSAVG
ncbi:hypothetical protein ACQEVB_24485 [Pseudonocardia sp. CA-107938]|uniref:hypothetical protein n=1 Tax=Pseudonocardia sp. CA-107938 TaxID=3240021 RepID=UPI003D8F061B